MTALGREGSSPSLRIVDELALASFLFFYHLRANFICSFLFHKHFIFEYYNGFTNMEVLYEFHSKSLGLCQQKTTEKSHIILDSICLIGWNIGLFDAYEVQQNSRK